MSSQFLARARFAGFLLGFAASVHAGAATLQKLDQVTLTTTRQFVGQSPGSVAFLPTVGDMRYLDRVGTYQLLPQSGHYVLAKKGNYFFRVNHAAADEKKSYLGVVVVLIYPDSIDHRNAIHLTRNNAAWSAGAGRVLSKDASGPSDPEVSIADFYSAHDQSDVVAADALLKFTWHAEISGEDVSTFRQRAKWRQSNPEGSAQVFSQFLRLIGVDSAKYKKAVTAHILQFTTTPNPTKPVVFWFNADHASGAYMRLFSPIGPEFDRYFWFKFGQ